MRDQLPGPEFELRHRNARQKVEAALATVKSERNHYRSKVKSLTKEYFRESSALQSSYGAIMSLRNENLTLKERVAVCNSKFWLLC
jgi:hypothetical protein